MLLPLLLFFGVLWGGTWAQRWRSRKAQDTNYWLRVQSTVRVPRGLCVWVPCSFSYPREGSTNTAQVQGHWFNDKIDDPVATTDPSRSVYWMAKGRFQLMGSPGDGDCSLLLTDARMEDQGAYFFRAEGGPALPYNFLNNKFFLDVTALTEKPHIHIPEPLKTGRPTQLTCSLPGACEGGRPFTFSWKGAAVDSLEPHNLSSSVLTFTPRPWDHGTNLTCQVQVQGSSVAIQTTIRLNVSYAPVLMIRLSQGNSTALKTLSNHTSLSVLEGQSLLLVCEADSNPPTTLSWSQEGRPLSLPQPSAPGVLELPHVGAGDGGEFTCRAQHPLGFQHVSFSLSVQSNPPSCRCVTEEQQGSWPLVITLIRGALMGAGFLLTYMLTWFYYTRCGSP